MSLLGEPSHEVVSFLTPITCVGILAGHQIADVNEGELAQVKMSPVLRFQASNRKGTEPKFDFNFLIRVPVWQQLTMLLEARKLLGVELNRPWNRLQLSMCTNGPIKTL